MRKYTINLRSAIGTHLFGLGYYDENKLFYLVDVLYMSFKVYKKCEEYLGEEIL